MARAVFRHIALSLSAGALLMGCVEGGGKGASKGSGAGLAPPAAARGAALQEVQAPEVFQATDSGLWDGRPSLGGIWVASPEAKDPERVVMFNPATGKTVTGALFRRERDNPGPKLQVSSDAAEALGMLAGQPTEIRVTALRKVEAAEAAPAAPGSTDAAATGGKSVPDAAETAALAAAALGAADATAAATPPAAVAGEAAVEPPAPEAPKRKTWKERRAEAKARREAEKAAKAAAATGAAAGAAGAATVVDPAAGAVVAIETAPLDARSAEAAGGAPGTAPAPAPEKKTRRQIRAEQEAAAAAAAAAAEAPAVTEAPAATAGARPILIASFSKEDNARRAADALAKIGITAGAEKSDRDGKAVWGVVASGDAALLDKIKAAGFADAYFLK